MIKILGCKTRFNNPEILKQALTHRSVGKGNNERLEFLGDSILGFVIAQWLYDNYPTLSEGKLSRMRSSLVKGATLAEVARHYNLSEQLILGVGELKSGGFNRSSVLADAVEAVIGAVFLDQGIDSARTFILDVMNDWLNKVNPNVTDKDAKTRLQEYLQKNGYPLPDYELLEKFGKDHMQTFKIQCEIPDFNLKAITISKSRKKAEQLAAEEILKQIPDATKL